MSGTDPDPDPEPDADGDPAPERTAEDEGDATGPLEGERTTRGPGPAGPDAGSVSRDPTALYERLRSAGERVLGSYSAIVVIAVVVGLVLAPIVATVATQSSSGTVAVIPLEGGIDGGTATALSATLERARQDPDIDAVVLQINSGGGSASASEAMYLEVSRTAGEMPVVSSVDAIAASGAYHAAVGTDRIFVRPASLVGSVGVLFTPPPRIEPNDIILTTGPSKLSGGTERGWRYKTESVQEAFLSAVIEGRGESLEIPRERVATAELFSGAEAVETGMADEIGTTRGAVEYAAAQAGLSSYDVTVLRPQSNVSFLTQSAYLASDAPNRTKVSVRYFIGEESENQYPNFLMIPPGVVGEELAEGSPDAAARATATPKPGSGSADATDDTGAPNGTDRPGTTPEADLRGEVTDGR